MVKLDKHTEDPFKLPEASEQVGRKRFYLEDFLSIATNREG
jgi:hypothetical protein